MIKNTNPNPVSSLDVDTRFLLANERTFLAWVRTALTLMAGGLALSQLAEGKSAQFGMVAVFFGAVTAIIGYVRYLAADKAIRNHRLPLHGRGPLFQLVGVVVFALVVIALELSK